MVINAYAQQVVKRHALGVCFGAVLDIPEIFLKRLILHTKNEGLSSIILLSI